MDLSFLDDDVAAVAGDIPATLSYVVDGTTVTIDGTCGPESKRPDVSGEGIIVDTGIPFCAPASEFDALPTVRQTGTITCAAMGLSASKVYIADLQNDPGAVTIWLKRTDE